MKLLVGSIFCGRPVETPNKKWLELQLKFLEKTSPPFEHVVCLSGISNKKLFANSHILDETDAYGPKQYVRQMNVLVEHFKTQKDVENFLILDSDAFPVMNNWIDKLRARMGDKWYASPMRVENMDNWPHACAMFIPGEQMQRDFLKFEGTEYENLLGIKCKEIGAGHKQKEGDKQIWHPLFRTNVWNPHPIEHAIYAHSFYHHAAGSRKKVYRASEMSDFYSERVAPASENLTQQLFEAPDKFVQKLLGYTPLFL